MKNTTNTIIPNNPYIIEGIPAKLSVANLIILTILPGFAYSTKYIAANIPIGQAIISDKPIIYNDVTTKGTIPPPGLVNIITICSSTGKLLINSLASLIE